MQERRIPFILPSSIHSAALMEKSPAPCVSVFPSTHQVNFGAVFQFRDAMVIGAPTVVQRYSSCLSQCLLRLVLKVAVGQ